MNALPQVISFALLLFRPGECQLPISCQTADPNQLCCIYNGQQCNGRGSCDPLDDNLYFKQYRRRTASKCASEDPRIGWPRSLGLTHYCKCDPEWAGYACQYCSNGYIGNGTGECVRRNSTTKIIRKNAYHMSSAEWSTFLQVLNTAKTTPSAYKVIYSNSSTAGVVNPGTSNASISPATYYEPVTVYDLFVWMHYYAAKNNNDSGPDTQCDFAHESSGFLTWHRAFLLFVETELQQLPGTPKNFGLPYWDWTNNDVTQLKYLFDQDRIGRTLMFGTDTSSEEEAKMIPETTSVNPIDFNSERWRIVCNVSRTTPDDLQSLCDPRTDMKMNEYVTRCLGCMKDLLVTGNLPKSKDLKTVIDRAESYDSSPWNKSPTGVASFRNALEGYVPLGDVTGNSNGGPKNHEFHNKVHIYCGETMYDVRGSPNDPVFFLHHSNIDRMFERWLTAKERGFFVPESTADVHPGHAKDDWIVPIWPPVTNGDMFKSGGALGFEYDSLEIGSSDAATATADEVNPTTSSTSFQDASTLSTSSQGASGSLNVTPLWICYFLLLLTAVRTIF